MDTLLSQGKLYSRAKALEEFFLGNGTWSDLFDIFLRRQNQLTRVILESNFFSLNPQILWQAFPKAKFVVLVRDGRDCADRWDNIYNPIDNRALQTLDTNETLFSKVSGKLIVPWWVANGEENLFLESSPYVRCIWLWKHMIRTCISFMEEEPYAELIFIKYEDIVLNPLRVSDSLAKFLQLSSAGKLCKHLQRLSCAEVGLFRNRSLSDIRQAEKLAASELKYFQYI
jgi:hypothetical protein